MEAFTVHTGTAVPLRRSDVDTDQIIPVQYLKRTSRNGFLDGLFAIWKKDPNFELNLPRYRNASILVAGNNFGTGSSREHAVWALQEAGFRVVISPRFGDIFRSNSLKNGLLAIVLDREVTEDLQDQIEENPNLQFEVDLVELQLRVGGARIGFEISKSDQHRLTNGLDDIDLTLRNAAMIDEHEAGRAKHLPTVV